MKYVPIGVFALFTILIALILRGVLKDFERMEKFQNLKRNRFYFIVIYLAHLNLLILDLVRPRDGILNRNVTQWIGLFLYVYSILLLIYVVATFKESFRGENPDALKDFVKDDAYSISRNPIYKSFILLILGSLLTYTKVSYLMLLIIAILLVISEIIKEEKALEFMYGKKYIRYKKKVKKF